MQSRCGCLNQVPTGGSDRLPDIFSHDVTAIVHRLSKALANQLAKARLLGEVELIDHSRDTDYEFDPRCSPYHVEHLSVVREVLLPSQFRS